MNWSTRLQEPKYWLLAIVSAIAVLHLTLLNRSGESELFATSLLFWVAAGSLLWERHHALELQSSPGSSLVGSLLLSVMLLRVLSSPDSLTTLWLLPLLSLIAVGLMASGVQGVRQYWRELIIFGLLALYPLLELTLQAIDLSVLTAKTAHVILAYLGVAVQREKEVFLYVLRDGIQASSRVQVYGACSGIHNVLQMISIAVLFLLMFPLRSHTQKVVCLGVAIATGFLVNAFRVALMVILNDAGNKVAFDYWHEGTGSLIFSALSVLIFGTFCWFFYLRKLQDADPGASDA